MNQKISEWWDNLTPNSRKSIALVGGIGGAILIAIAISSLTTPETKAKRKAPTPAIQTVLTDYNAKTSTLEALSSEIKFLRTENEKMRKEVASAEKDRSKNLSELERRLMNEITNLKEANAQLSSQISIADTRASELDRDVQHVERFTIDEIEKLRKDGVQIETDEKGNARPVTTLNGAFVHVDGTLSENPKIQGVNDIGVSNALEASTKITASTSEEFFAQAPKPENTIPKPVIDTNTGKAKVGKDGKPILTERTITITSHTEPKKPEVKPQVEADYVFIPSGSILSGTFLNGLDAPTGQSSQKNPFPTLVRIQKEAILPNNYTADVRECFVLLSGYGDLSSERAMLRGETISCIRNDGGVIETALSAYAVGDDGKAGVRGTLVSKQGQIIARALVAGFAGGFADMFNVTSTPTLNTSSDGTIKYEDMYSSKAVKGGLSQGVSKALDRVADFYMDLADSMFPVIEIDAGRQVDIIVTTGTKMRVQTVNEISNTEDKRVEINTTKDRR